MATSASWIAVRGKSDIAVLDLLGLARTGRFESVPESAFLGLDLPAGWFLVYYTDHFAGELDATAMQLSVGCEIVLGRMDEGRMCSMASGWKNACELWGVMHDAQHSRIHLQACGTPPPEFAVIRARRLAEQEAAGGNSADEDYVFEIPLELIESLTGFHYDEPPSGGFEVLERHVRVVTSWGPNEILAALKNTRR